MPHLPTRQRPCAGSRRSFSGSRLMLATLLAWPLAASAQERPLDRPGARLPDVLNAQATVPPVKHSSVFARYRRLGDTPVGSWRDANDTVTRIGGWRVYTREAHAPEPAEPPQPAAAVPPSAPAGARP